jgi:hypothetical protein
MVSNVKMMNVSNDGSGLSRQGLRGELGLMSAQVDFRMM